jgi:hypothetical protein
MSLKVAFMDSEHADQNDDTGAGRVPGVRNGASITIYALPVISPYPLPAGNGA